MQQNLDKLTRSEITRLKCPVKCRKLYVKIKNLPDYLALISGILSEESIYWFRGHRDISWTLKPSALRYKTPRKRRVALDLLPDFRRIAEIKCERPPGQDENLKWLQLAQHYGLPTRLLDWTESAIFALYFACTPPKKNEEETDGIVFLFNPVHLSKLKRKNNKTSLDAHMDESLIQEYFNLDAKRHSRGVPTIAIKPVWNSERLMLQRGVFTLHGSIRFALNDKQLPSLVGIPILSEYKKQLRSELDRIGIDEMTMFPELEHACIYLKRHSGLD